VGGTRAYYAIGEDQIQLPPFECFRNRESYYATLLHELTHWTRHPTRLDRDFGRKKWGDERYAREELVAEIGAAFLCVDLGITPEPLKSDSRAIFSAAAHAQKAADYLASLQVQRAIRESRREPRSQKSTRGAACLDALLAEAERANQAREQKKRFGHLPGTMAEALPYFRDLLARHHAAMLAADAERAMALRREAHDCALRLNDGAPGILADEDAPGRVVERLTAATPGDIPLWGSKASFLSKCAACVYASRLRACSVSAPIGATGLALRRMSSIQICPSSAKRLSQLCGHPRQTTARRYAGEIRVVGDRALHSEWEGVSAHYGFQWGHQVLNKGGFVGGGIDERAHLGTATRSISADEGGRR
jgi:hypothetical protein